MGRDGSGWEAEGGLKQPLRLKEQCCAFSLWHKLIQSTKEAKTGVRNSLVVGKSFEDCNTSKLAALIDSCLY